MARTDDPKPLADRLRAIGMPSDIIVNRLVLEGWSEDAARAALGTAGAPAPLAPQIATPSSAESPAPITAAPTAEVSASPIAANVRTAPMATGRGVSYRTLSGILLVLVALGVSAYFYIAPPRVYSISIPGMEASSTLPLQYGALPALSDPDYYASVKANMIKSAASFIDANLETMQLNVYVNGTSTLTVPILAKGKVGSWWETPAGIYSIQTKETNHLSSIGDVYMPYSMDFQGNFFIHGWPYYPDGTPVSTSYSGGSIRLSTDDAKKVFDIAKVGMPVVVYNSAAVGDDFDYQLKAPSISAQDYLVADLANGTVLVSQNASSTAPIASVTKLITALVATEYINLDKEITVPSSAIVYTSVPRLRAGSLVKAYDLLFLLLQESSNEAAETLAAEKGRAQFVSYMNQKAKAIGLTNTVFTDPSGAKADVSTPEDLFKLLKYIYANRRFVFGITTGEITDSAYGAPSFKNIQNFNQIKGASAKLIGGKVGQTTEAGETYAGIFQVDVGGVPRDIAVIVLGSHDSPSDVAKLLNFVHSQYAPAQSP